MSALKRFFYITVLPCFVKAHLPDAHCMFVFGSFLKYLVGQPENTFLKEFLCTLPITYIYIFLF